MSASEKKPQPPEDALFFGYLEGLAFSGLFLSLLLPAQTAPFVWLAIPLIRFVALALRTLPLSHPDRNQDRSRLSEFLREGWPYQLPFWGAGLLFPLQDGQATLAACALGFQLGLTLILAVAIRASTQPSALCLLYLATWGWLCLWSPFPQQLVLGALGLALTLNRTALSAPIRCTPRQSLALSTAWLALWLLPPLCQQPPSRLLVGWLVVTANAIVFAYLVEKSKALAESEQIAPAEVLARSWRLRRQSLSSLRPWAAFLALAVQSPQDLGLFGLLLCAWWRSSLLATQRLSVKDNSVWWVAAETTLLWAFLRGGYSLQLLTLSALVCPLLSHVLSRKLARPELESVALPALERRLRQGLHFECPPGLRARVVEESATVVELEKELIAPEQDLIAAAPAGFRQRLLDRLRQSRDEEEP